MINVTLNVKKQWFDMILSGEKKEEYREIKDLYLNKFCTKEHYKFEIEILHNAINCFPDTITFLNGMKKQTPTIVIECKGITVGKGKTHWGAEPHEQYFVIKLGNIISTKNIKLDLTA